MDVTTAAAATCKNTCAVDPNATHEYLREQALVYALQAYSCTATFAPIDVIETAKRYLAFLKGDA